jgi:hypothetical protein
MVYMEQISGSRIILPSCWWRVCDLQLGAFNAIYFASRLITFNLILLSPYGLRPEGRRVIKNSACHMSVLVPCLRFLLPFHTHLKRSTAHWYKPCNGAAALILPFGI